MAELKYPRPGTPGASAQRVHDSLAHQAAAWGAGAAGERLVWRSLGRGRRAVVLHDRAQPGGAGNLDHIAVAPTGVYVIDTKVRAGTVELVNRGGWRRPEFRLHVGGWDRHDLVVGCRRQAALVRSVVNRWPASAIEAVPVVPVLCFVGAEWRIVSARADTDGVLITSLPGLRRLVRRSGPWGRSEVTALAGCLDQALPPR